MFLCENTIEQDGVNFGVNCIEFNFIEYLNVQFPMDQCIALIGAQWTVYGAILLYRWSRHIALQAKH